MCASGWKVLLVASLALASTACTRSGPCNDYAQAVDLLREKSLGCTGVSSAWDYVVLDERVALCEEPAAKYCTSSDEKVFQDLLACFEKIKACEGGQEAADTYADAVDDCMDTLDGDTLSVNCAKAVGRLL